jgi:hypothetical protein
MRVLAMLQLKSSDKIAQAQYLISIVHKGREGSKSGGISRYSMLYPYFSTWTD